MTNKSNFEQGGMICVQKGTVLLLIPLNIWA